MTFEEFKNGIKTVKPQENCSVGKTLELLNGKWTSKVIFELQKADVIRFGELKRNLNGITNTMLSSTLKNLEEHGIVQRQQFDEMPVRVEYSLTDAGKAMLPIYYEIALWGDRFFPNK